MRRGSLMFRVRNRRVRTFLICVLVSFFIWLARQLRETVDFSLPIPVEFVGFSQMELEKGYPYRLVLYGEATRYTVLRLLLSTSYSPYRLDISQIDDELMESGKPIRTIRLNSKTALQNFAQQMADGLTITSISPSSFTLTFDRKTSKQVPLVLEMTTPHQATHRIRIENLLPDSIEVFGAESVLDTLKYVALTPLHLAKIVQRDSIALSPVLPPRCVSSLSSVYAVVSMERFTDAVLEIPIEVDGPLPRQSLWTLPEKVKVYFRVSLLDYESIRPEDFRVVVSPPTEGEKMLPVTLKKAPDYAYHLRHEPKQVEYLIEDLK